MLQNPLGTMVDSYTIRARLYPAFLLLAPIWASLFLVFHVSFRIDTATIAFLSSLGVFYFIAATVRTRGKKLESKLITKWGGKETTRLQRHRDSTIDPVTKARFHSFLERHLGTAFPSVEDELRDPDGSDHLYESGTIWLLSKTRDKSSFNLLFNENISYGFQRNCLALKPYAIGISFATLILPIIHYHSVVNGFCFWRTIPIQGWAACFVSIGVALGWGLLVTESSVRMAAEAYAMTLLRACDSLPKKR